jgi:hypothetical protein
LAQPALHTTIPYSWTPDSHRTQDVSVECIAIDPERVDRRAYPGGIAGCEVV